MPIVVKYDDPLVNLAIKISKEKQHKRYEANKTRLKENRERLKEKKKKEHEDQVALLREREEQSYAWRRESLKRKYPGMFAIIENKGFKKWYEQNFILPWCESFEADEMLFLSVACNIRSALNREEEEAARKAAINEYQKEGLSGAERRLVKQRLATPIWRDKGKISEVYEERDKRNKSSDPNDPFQVDHIYPIQGELVCGLHVHQNLQVIPRSENIRKRNEHPDLDLQFQIDNVF